MNKGLQTGVQRLFQPFAQKNILLQFFAFWVLSSALYLVALAALMDVVPPGLEWLRRIVVHISVITGFVASVISTYRNKGTSTTLNTIAQDGIITLIGAALLIILYVMSLAISPPEYVTSQEFRDALSNMGLTDPQILQVDDLISERLASGDYVTEDTIEMILEKQGFNDVQLKQLVSILDDEGYIKRDQIPTVVRAEMLIMATETAIAEMTACRVTPKPGFSTVTIRNSPKCDSGNAKGYLVENEEVIVIGHNGGEVNIDKWWFVEFGHGSSEEYGWVASWVVDEINESECARVKPAHGY